MRIGLDHCVEDVEDAVGAAVGNRRQRYRSLARSVVQVRHELSTRFVILAGKPGLGDYAVAELSCARAREPAVVGA